MPFLTAIRQASETFYRETGRRLTGLLVDDATYRHLAMDAGRVVVGERRDPVIIALPAWVDVDGVRVAPRDPSAEERVRLEVEDLRSPGMNVDFVCCSPSGPKP